MTINNNKTNKDTIYITCGAKATIDNDGPAKLVFQGYSGNAVDLSSYGFDYPMVYNIAGMEIQQKTPILYDHYDAIGHTTSIRKVDNGTALRGKGLASLPGTNTDKVVTGAKNGFPWQASMGLKINDWRKDIKLHDKGTVTVNGREFQTPIYVANKSVLREMTVTPFGRDSDTSFEFLNQEKRMVIKNSSGPDTKDTKDTDPPTPPVVDNKDTDPPTPPVVDNKDDKDKKETDPPTPPVLDNKDKKTTGLDPVVRRSMSLLNKNPGCWELIEKGLDNGWDDEAIENSIKLHNMNKDLPTPPSPQKKGEAEATQMLVNMAMSFGASPEFLAKKFDEKVVDNANNRSQMGIQELLINAANANGGDYNGFSNIDNVCKHLKNAGYSTFDLPDFFEKVGDLVKEERWEINPPFAPSVCKEGSNKNLNPTQRARITGGDMWNHVADDGKLELYATGDQKKYSTELETFGTVFTITRKDALADDMNVIQDLMDMMVEGATMIPDYLLGKKMINQLPSAGTFWVDDDNSFDGTALTRTNLSTAYNAVRQYTEVKDRINWNVLLNERWTLIVSPNLEEAAWDILKQDRIVNDTTANTKTGDKNYWFGRMDIKVFGQMANTSAFTSGSKFVGNTTWILWPSSLKFSPYEITYLRGQKKPVIETVDLPATLLGFGTRGYWDVSINERERTAVSRYTATA